MTIFKSELLSYQRLLWMFEDVCTVYQVMESDGVNLEISRLVLSAIIAWWNTGGCYRVP